MTPGRSERGHRLLPHTADVRLEAWGGDLAACVEEAVLALVEVFADTTGAPDADTVPVAFDAASPDELLLDALGEVIYRLDVDGAVPVGVRLVPAGGGDGGDGGDGGLEGELDLAPLDRVEVVGPEPKAVARSGLEVATAAAGTVTARVTVDV